MSTDTTDHSRDQRPIVVGVDASEGADSALRWALYEGALTDRPVKTVAVWSHLDQHPLTDQTFLTAFDQKAAAVTLHELVSPARADFPDTVVVEEAVCDLPARALIDASNNAELLVVGARGLGTITGVLLGSVSDKCVRHSACPVAVIRGAPSEGVRNEIVVGIDGSAHAAAALRWAIAEADRRGASVKAIHTWQYPPVSGMGWDAIAYDIDAFEAAAKESLNEAMEAVADETSAVLVDAQTAQGHSGTALIEAADGAAMLVVGARGVGGLAGLLLGSTTTHCLHHAHGPVVVVR